VTNALTSTIIPANTLTSAGNHLFQLKAADTNGTNTAIVFWEARVYEDL
jgi:hypothetical protein